MSLKVIPIDPKETAQHPKVSNPLLPQHEFLQLLVATMGSGKTNLLLNYVTRFYKGYFHRIIVCSPTVNNDPKWGVLKGKPGILAINPHMKDSQGVRDKSKISKEKITAEMIVPKQKFEGLHEITDRNKPKQTKKGMIPESDFITTTDELLVLMAEQDKSIKDMVKRFGIEQGKFKSDRVLALIDDQAGLFKGSNNNNPFLNFIFKHRHYNTSVCMVTQSLKAIPKSVRTNAKSLIVFETPSEEELKAIYETRPISYSYPAWKRMYKEATEEDFSFMYINITLPKREKIWKRFDTKLETDEIVAYDELVKEVQLKERWRKIALSAKKNNK